MQLFFGFILQHICTPLALKIKKILSYLWPVTRRFSSEINGTLEVTYIDGKKVLDTANANYSYGSLQKILAFGLTKIDLKPVKNLLLLGMGGGSVIQSLREGFEYGGNITAIEIDPTVIQIAKEEFGITESNNQRIIQADAFQYVKNCNDSFQLIIIDLFIDTEVPAVFHEKEFCQNIAQRIDDSGFLIFNIGINLKKDSNRVQYLISYFGKDFDFQIYRNVNGTNSMLIGKKIREGLQ